MRKRISQRRHGPFRADLRRLVSLVCAALGGILGAILTGVFVSPALGGPGFVTDWVTASTGFTSIGEQVWIQFKAVALTVVWTGVVSVIGFWIVDKILGLRVSEEEEREGLDTTYHGESAYKM